VFTRRSEFCLNNKEYHLLFNELKSLLPTTLEAYIQSALFVIADIKSIITYKSFWLDQNTITDTILDTMVEIIASNVAKS
jgi:hypothetical protein